jgi:hypothetical protein
VKEPVVITESAPAPVFGRDGEPCPVCGAPLAGDQRYCLHCGARRPEARLEFLDVLDADVRARSVLPAAASAPPQPAAPAGGVEARLQAHSGSLALGALLLLTLLIGLLVGHWVTGSAPHVASTPAPQVIRVEGAAAPAAAAAAAHAAGGGSGGSSSSSGRSSSSGDDAAAAKTPKDAVSVKKVAGDKKAIEKAVKKGKPIATGGKPLPKDDKPAGNGTSFETIQ